METLERRWHDDGRPRRTGRQAKRGNGKLVSLYRLLDAHGGEIEADLQREYGVDLIDFYRGTLSARRLGVLVKHLSVKSSLVRALNDGHPQWITTDHLIADLWALWAKQDHPRRAEMEEKARTTAKLARVVELRTTFEQRKAKYGLTK